MKPILDMSQFTVLTIGRGTYRILKGREEEFMRKYKQASKPQKTGAQQFASAYKSQTRTYATPAERARIMAELTASGDYQEYATEQVKPDYPIITDIKQTMFYIPSFTNSERIAA